MKAEQVQGVVFCGAAEFDDGTAYAVESMLANAETNAALRESYRAEVLRRYRQSGERPRVHARPGRTGEQFANIN